MRLPSAMRLAQMKSVVLLPLLATSVGAQDWSQWAGAGTPVAMFPGMVYDLQRARCVLFGGWNQPGNPLTFSCVRHPSTWASNVLDQTWEFDGSTWTLRTPATRPPARDSHAMAHDIARGRSVMFGGWDAFFTHLVDTWEWDGTNWTNMLPASSPPGRQRAANGLRRRTTRRGVVRRHGSEWDAVERHVGVERQQLVTASHRVCSPAAIGPHDGVRRQSESHGRLRR